MAGPAHVAIRSVALFEAAKGVLVLITGLGLATALHHGFEHTAEQLVHHLHLNPARHYPQIFIQAAAHLSNMHLWALALGAGSYSALRLAEAYGLWKERAWAEWLAAVSGGVYVPFEIYELFRGITPLRVATFVVNLAVVAIMVYALRRRRAAAARMPTG
jgi:uncharacterized membrane protein (DUF2068 family)